ncbi:MAG: copper chaperone PCu(A)C [Rhizobiaceae bacterium]|nr:copper chaperone PCu(A)C [Rhizobiaceae bacterium]
MTRLLAALAMSMALSGVALAHQFKVGPIEVGHPWSRPTPPSAPVASGYVKLTNGGAETDRLVEITSPIGKRAEIHRSLVQDGVATMRPLTEGVAIEPGATVDFEAERLHVMFIEPTRQLKEDEKFPATLVFEKAGSVEVEFVVQRRPAPAAPEDHSGHGAAP